MARQAREKSSTGIYHIMLRGLEDYGWSSYEHYNYYYNGQDTIISGDLVKAYFKTFKNFSDFILAENDDKCMDYSKIVWYYNRYRKENSYLILMLLFLCV